MHDSLCWLLFRGTASRLADMLAVPGCYAKTASKLSTIWKYAENPAAQSV